MNDPRDSAAENNHQTMGTLWSQRARHGQEQFSDRLWQIIDARLVLTGSKCAKKQTNYYITTNLN